MTSWPTRGENDGYHQYDNNPAYANVPSTPSLTDPLQPPVRSPLSSNSGRSAYVSSPLNPNASGSGSGSGARSRPVSWGGNGGLDKVIADSTASRPGGSSGSDGSSNSAHEREGAMKGILSGTVGGNLGPYAVSPSVVSGTISF